MRFARGSLSSHGNTRDFVRLSRPADWSRALRILLRLPEGVRRVLEVLKKMYLDFVAFGLAANQPTKTTVDLLRRVTTAETLGMIGAESLGPSQKIRQILRR